MNGHVSNQGEAFGKFRLPIKAMMVFTNLVHIVAASGSGTWSRQLYKIIENQDPGKLSTEIIIVTAKGNCQG